MTIRGRELLGPADVIDADLESFVAAVLAESPVTVLDCWAEVAEYDLVAITTAGRFWVRGTAATPTGCRSFGFFVKVVQSWGRSPLIEQVPAQIRDVALASVPWRTEPDIYRSDLSTLLPDGLTMPRAHAVLDLDEESAAIWLEEVPTVAHEWDAPRFARAAFLLGRLAASERVSPVAALVPRRPAHRHYAEGRLAHQVLPLLRSDIWAHPLVSSTFDADLRASLRDAAAAMPGYLDELDAVPLGTAHGDACPRNLLVTRADADGFVLIDYGFWGTAPVGFDLGQLLLGEIQTGERPSKELAGLHAACLPAYVDGLRAEGLDVDEATVARANALLMLEFFALSAIPFEALGGEITPQVHHVAGERAQAARFVLELVHATA